MNATSSIFFIALTLVPRPGAAGQPARPPSSQPQASQTPKPTDPKPQSPYKPDFALPRPDAQPGPTPSATAAGANYVIGAQDQISITVVDETDLTGKFRVDGDGMFTYPYLGRVIAAGLTLTELQTRLTTQLQNGYVRNPQVRVEIDVYKSQAVFVNGKVRTPGKVTMTGTQMTLLEALALAGSPTADASNEVIVVHPRRPVPPGATPSPDAPNEAEEIRVNRKDLELGRAGQDVILRDGDIINVPEAQHFYMSGQVRNPGTYVLDPGMTVQQAIALAGGLTERGSSRGVKATRMIKGKSTDVDLNLEDKIQPGDTIIIRQRFF